MSLREITELAAIISAHGDHIISAPSHIPDVALHNYWNLAKQESRQQIVQLEELASRFEKGSDEIQAPSIHDSIRINNQPWLSKEQVALSNIIEDCFTSEILTRVWAVILTATDRKRNESYGEPIARSTMVFQLQVRMKALQLMVDSKIDQALLARLNLIRRRAELWTDFLIGHLIIDSDMTEFAFDATRSERFGIEHLYYVLNYKQSSPWDNLMTSNHYIEAMESVTEKSSGSMTMKLVGSILNCFPDMAFYENGRFRPIPVSPERKKKIQDVIPRS